MELEFFPLTSERWADLETLFGARGACAGCWCMYWRLSRADFDRQHGEGTRLALKALVESGGEPGILAYHAGQPVGWCALARREDYPLLGRSHILRPVDDQPVWSITCFFVAHKFRRQGVTGQLVQAALNFARQHGARLVEAYPEDVKDGKTADVFLYTGVAEVFRRAGFVEVARRSEKRPIMRYTLNGRV